MQPRPLARSLRLPLVVALCTAAALLGAREAEAQPFGAWYTNNAVHRYVSVPDHPDLDPGSAFTFEAWVFFSGGFSSCPSIAGKGFQTTWWIGACAGSGGNGVLRSYLTGNGSNRDGGIIPPNTWTHLAVTYDGAQRRHYINGELAAQFAQVGPLPSNGSPVRIGSDVDWQNSPSGAIDEVRLWSVARTLAQLRASINVRINTPQPGLVAVWALDGNGNDVVGARDGSLVNGPLFFTFAVASDCGSSSASTLCLNDRFQVRAWWRTNPTPGTPVDGAATTVAFTAPDSGLFWFFASSNWEIMVKVLDGCGLNNRYWVFSAATTNVFYRLEVTDVHGAQKIYFNYPGPPAPAVTDTSAFATCP